MYIEIEDLRLYLGVSLTTDNLLLEAAIEDAQSYIESQTNRKFEATTATRYYDRSALDVNDASILHLDYDLLTVTTLTNGDASATTIASSYYTLLPRNATPYDRIKLDVDSAYYWEWDTDYWVSVAGTWGYSSDAPYDIKRATLTLAAYFYRAKDSQVFDTTAIPSAGVITIPAGIPQTVTRVIERYKRYL